MAVTWDRVQVEHVRRACELTISRVARPRVPAKGIVVDYRGHELPAKHVLRTAYCLAHEMPLDSEVRFASGEGTIRLLGSLGFIAHRRSAEAGVDEP